MKKVMSMVLSIVMLITMLSVGFSVQAAGKSSIYKYCAVYEKDDEGHYVIVQKPESYFDSLTTVYNYYDENTNTLYIKGKGEIPFTYLSLDNKPVNEDGIDEDYEWDYPTIGDPDISETFGKLEEVKHLVIEDGITSVGIKAFANSLPNCETLTLPSSLKRIGVNAFSDCGFKSVNFSKGIEKIDAYAFCDCKNLENFALPNTLKSIGVIYGCDALEEIRIPSSVKGNASIVYCNSLKTVVFGQKSGVILTEFGGSAVHGCPNLESLYILQKTLKKLDWTKIKPDKFFNNNDSFEVNDYYSCPSILNGCPKATLYAYSGNYDYIKAAKWRKINYRLLDAPKAVTKLKAAKVTANSIKLTWKESKNATFYKVQRYYYGKKKWETLANVKGTSYTVEKISSASTYKFRVKPVNKTKATYEAGKYAYVNATTKPAMTKNVKVKKSAGKLKVSYSKVKNATDYQIYIKTGKNGEYKKAGTTTKTAFTTAKLKKGKNYYVKVRARKKVSKGKYTYGAYSKEIAIKI